MMQVTPSSCSVDHSLVRQRCKFSCPPGYRLVGSRSARCRRNTQWKHNGGPPKCARVQEEEVASTRAPPSSSYDYTTTTTVATTQTPKTTTTEVAAVSFYGEKYYTTPFSYTRPYIYCPPDVTR